MDDLTNRIEGAARITVHNPVGYPPKITKKTAMANRKFTAGPANTIAARCPMVVYLSETDFSSAVIGLGASSAPPSMTCMESDSPYMRT